MDDRRIGLAFRALRRRLGWRQSDLARRARVRQQEVSDIEGGHFERVRIGTMRRLGGALDARVSVDLQWRGGMLDRLLDHRHAQLVERTAAVLTACGWQVRPEVSFGIGRDYGSIDLLAWHEASRTVLIIEVKTELTSIEETIRRFDVKIRVGPQVALDLLGWKPALIGSLLILPEASTARRRVVEYSRTFGARFPQAGQSVRGWLKRPAGPMAAVWFLSIDPDGGTKRAAVGPHRVRVRNAPPPSSPSR